MIFESFLIFLVGNCSFFPPHWVFHAILLLALVSKKNDWNEQLMNKWCDIIFPFLFIISMNLKYVYITRTFYVPMFTLLNKTRIFNSNVMSRTFIKSKHTSLSQSVVHIIKEHFFSFFLWFKIEFWMSKSALSLTNKLFWK